MDKLYLSSLGGSGENGRNCYLIETPDGCLLLDCGVKREIADGQVGFYPDLAEETVARIKAVFLSHCHEDHVAGLPLLYQMGYQGKIYASPETISEVPGFIRKWMGYVEKNHGRLPYEPKMVEKLQFVPIEMGEQEITEFKGLRIETGRSGHVLGGFWYIFTINGKRILYTGDMCKDPGTLAWDCPGICDAAIMNAAYAGKQINQQEQYAALRESVKTCVESGGKVMLPVPPKGRGIDITIFLAKALPDACLYVEESVISSMKELATKDEWIRKGILDKLPENLNVICTEEERKAALEYDGGAVYIAPDGMISTDLSLEYYHVLKGNRANKFIISGHAAKGTAGAGVLDETYRKEHGVLAAGEKIVFKVHMDDDDIRDLSNTVKAKQVILFHSDAELTENIKRLLKEDGIEGLTLLYPEKMEVRSL